MALFADVILPLPVEGTFTYALPADMAEQVAVGSRLIVPFGTRKFYTGIVLKLHDIRPPYAIKEVMELLDERPLILPQQLSLWHWIADYYLCTLGDVYKAALPSGLKLESESRVLYVDDFEYDSPLTPAEQQVVGCLEQVPERTVVDLQKETGIRHILPVMKSLLEKGVVRMKEEIKRKYKVKTITCVRLSPAYFDEERLRQAFEELKRSAKQAELLSCYTEHSYTAAALAMRNYDLLKEVRKQNLMEAAGCSPAVFRGLTDKGILLVYQQPVERIPSGQLPPQFVMHPLSAAQNHAMQQILEVWDRQDVCLLHGVTGSGKTEVYIHLIQRALEAGEQVLFLLPEIVLTAQLTDRLKRVFGNRLGVYHSRYPDAERVEVYQKMLSDEPYDIIVGVRSSIFLPFRRLGLLIIDEEHETSFKQQDPAPRYHARNAALMLASAMKAKTLLGTATPSLESYYNAQRGKYGLVELTTRYSDVRLPEIEVVDMAEQQRKKMMTGPFTPQLLKHVRTALDSHRQVILFQNRRGYAPMVECRDCGWTPRCQQCDVSLTMHRNQHQLTCHYCGSVYTIPDACPNCQSRSLFSRGYGTERIEDQLKTIFPEARIARMDLDTTRSRQQYEQILQDFQRGRTDILVGTQMVSKGLDFEHVSVVGILSADTMLNQPDFRSYERAFQLMEQVAGRAGRKHAQGHVVLQTRDVHSPVINQVVQHDYRSMYAQQMEDRQVFHYPPFCRLVFLYMKHRDERVLEQLATDVSLIARQVFGSRVLGPDTPPIARIQNLYIRKVILKIGLQEDIQDARRRLRAIQHHILSQPAYKSAQLYYDVD